MSRINAICSLMGFTSLISLGTTVPCWAQTNTKKDGAIVVGFEYSDKPDYNIYGNNNTTPLNGRFTVGDGKIVTFKIKNVNRFAYDVVLKGERVELFGQMPALFKSTLLPSSGEASKGGNQSAMGMDVATKYTQTLGFFNTASGALIELAELDETLTHMARNYTRLNDSLVRTIQTNAIVFAAKPLTTLGITINSIDPPEKTLETNSGIIPFAKGPALATVKQKFTDLTVAYNAYIADLETKIKDPNTKVQAEKDKAIADRSFADAKKTYDAIELADKVTTVGQQSELDKELVSAARVYESIRGGAAFEQQTSTRAGGDYVKFSYEIKPKADVLNPLPEIKDDISIPVHGSFRVTYSTGLFASNLTDDNLAAVTANNQQTVINKGKEDFILSIGALAHFYWRASGKWHRFQPAFSVGALTSGSQTQFLVGGSIIWGSDQRVVFTLGRAFGPAKRPAPGVVAGQALPTGITDPLQTRNTDAWFFGITYNFK